MPNNSTSIFPNLYMGFALWKSKLKRQKASVFRYKVSDMSDLLENKGFDNNEPCMVPKFRLRPFSFSYQPLEKIPRGSQVSSLYLLIEVDVPQVQPFRVGCHETLEHRPTSLDGAMLELVLGEPSMQRYHDDK